MMIDHRFAQSYVGFTFKKLVDYESEQPGLGHCLVYWHDCAVASVYVYQRHYSDLVDGPFSNPVTLEFDEAIDHVLAAVGKPSETMTLVQDVYLTARGPSASEFLSAELMSVQRG
jgi:hypothetical protein